MASYGILRRVALVRTGVSEELISSFVRLTRIGELGTTLAVTSKRRTLRRNTNEIFLQEPHGVTSQTTPFFIVTTVKTSNLTMMIMFVISLQEVLTTVDSVTHNTKAIFTTALDRSCCRHFAILPSYSRYVI
jgi:hypothetical protein